MRKTYSLLIALSLFGFIRAQNTFLFAPRFLPDRKYTTRLFTDKKMTAETPSGIAKKQNEKGQREFTITTGSTHEDSTFTVVLEIIKFTSSKDKQEVPEHTTLLGTATINSMPEFHNVNAPGKSAQFERTLLNSLGDILKQFPLEKKQLAIGDTMLQVSTLNMDVASLTVKSNTVYKVIAVKNGIARLEQSDLFTIEGGNQTVSMTGSGTGSGSLFYNIKEQLIIRESSNTSLTLHMGGETNSVNVSVIQKGNRSTSVKPFRPAK
ncbi:MAG: hypothetical protein U0T73_11245 [Chitinophagales bacterium]